MCPNLLNRCSFLLRSIGSDCLKVGCGLFLPKPPRSRHPFAGEARVMKPKKVIQYIYMYRQESTFQLYEILLWSMPLVVGSKITGA